MRARQRLGTFPFPSEACVHNDDGFSIRIAEPMPKRKKVFQDERRPDVQRKMSPDWPAEFIKLLGSWPDEIERPPAQPIQKMRDLFAVR